MKKNAELISQLKDFKEGKIDINNVIKHLNKQDRNPDVCIDSHRKKRCGFPEFIYGEGKTVKQIKSAIRKIIDLGEPVMVTRLSEKKFNKVAKKFPKGEYDHKSKVFIIRKKNESTTVSGTVALVTAGTSDIPAAMEAKYTAELCGCHTEEFFDIGVAGIHRLFNKLDKIRNADVIICAAGMEGALPSVVAGLVSCPVIALPTSVGYGTSMKGLTAMFAMMNSCASGVTVVNIDNGFGAGCAAARIINTMKKSVQQNN